MVIKEKNSVPQQTAGEICGAEAGAGVRLEEEATVLEDSLKELCFSSNRPTGGKQGETEQCCSRRASPDPGHSIFSALL